jgi:hypothetical protein
MERWHEPKSDALRALYWRDEILQLIFWLRGEGFDDRLDPRLLERFLGVDASAGRRHLDRLVDDGLLSCDEQGRYRLTEEGHRHSDRIFANQAVDGAQPDHGECGVGCWCQVSPEEAEERSAGRGDRMGTQRGRS